MIAYVTTPAAAATLCQQIASLLGYPRAGVDAASGEMRTDGIGVTTLWVAPYPHPTDATRAAVPVDDVVRSITDPTVAAAVAAAVELSADWFPVPAF